MKAHQLIVYKDTEFFVENIDEDMSELLQAMPKIHELDAATKDLYRNIMAPDASEKAAKVEKMKAELAPIKECYSLIGVPFDNRDARLLAADKGWFVEELHLHGNTGRTNAKKPKKKRGTAKIQFATIPGRKNAYVKQAKRMSEQAGREFTLKEWMMLILDAHLDDDLLEFLDED